MILHYVQVWQKLEEQNPDFFKAYITRLKLKDQINLFNHLLEQQIQVSSSLCNNAAAHLLSELQAQIATWPCQLRIHAPCLLQ